MERDMAKNERVRKAIMEGRKLSIPDEKIKQALKKLLRAFDGKWEPIEAENYRTLLDACFYDEDEKEMSGKEPINEEREDNKTLVKKRNTRQEGEGSHDDHRRKDHMIIDNSSSPKQKRPNSGELKRRFKNIPDISKGTERVEISLVDEVGNEDVPKFTYIPQNIVYQAAFVHISMARISDEDCCGSCRGDCLSGLVPCACARETGGEFAYTNEGLLKEEFLDTCIRMKKEPEKFEHFYCQDCPLERTSNEIPGKCNGHLIRKFIKECWRKCGCDMLCGNRVVQRGIRCRLQVFMTQEGKGWGLRSLLDLRKGSFVCEYVGEILTNTELYKRNISSCNERHTYPVTLDADWGSEKGLKDEEALCLDATYCGNVARFINHRCNDANLIDIPVEIETADRHYYHIAFFTTRNVKAMEELTWDYLIDFGDHSHPVKAFQCCCGSQSCRDIKPQGSRSKASERRRLLSVKKEQGARSVSVKRR